MYNTSCVQSSLLSSVVPLKVRRGLLLVAYTCVLFMLNSMFMTDGLNMLVSPVVGCAIVKRLFMYFKRVSSFILCTVKPV